jgi:hypothetical protein
MKKKSTNTFHAIGLHDNQCPKKTANGFVMLPFHQMEVRLLLLTKEIFILVNAAGGDAQAHTFHEAHDFMPVWSNDGKKKSLLLLTDMVILMFLSLI